MILYDVKTDSVSIVCNDTTTLEVYPTWSPDGKYLYYCKSVPLPEEMKGQDIRTTYQKIQYNLVRRSFDLTTHAFGDEELVYDAVSADKSVSLPRISPDGRYLLFALGQYGCFHSRHHDADIVCIPMEKYAGAPLTWETASPVDLTSVNSKGYSDSYPSWSSNGHWMMLASRRDDDNYSRVYFAYFNNGKAGKAFMMPQKDPELHTYLLKSYNRPEFMVEPVRISVNEFSKAF
jgi:Tol biopolymer transport system component